jgi:hypothetical protein
VRVAYDVRKAYAPMVQMTTQSYTVMMTPALPNQSIKNLPSKRQLPITIFFHCSDIPNHLLFRSTWRPT